MPVDNLVRCAHQRPPTRAAKQDLLSCVPKQLVRAGGDRAHFGLSQKLHQQRDSVAPAASLDRMPGWLPLCSYQLARLW